MALQTNETPKQIIFKQVAQWKSDRSHLDAHYRDLADHVWPMRVRFSEAEAKRSLKRYGKIINEAGTDAARTLQAGMFTGITSPARPWRRLTTADPDLARYGPVKRWLYTLNERLSVINRMSNFYNGAPTVFGDMGLFAMGAMGLFPDMEDLYRFYNFPIGSYWVSVNNRGIVDSFMREYQATVRQLVMEFGDTTPSGLPNWARFSSHVKKLWDHSNYDAAISVTHVIQPNKQYDPRRLHAKYKRFADVYFETGSNSSDQNTDAMLREGGFDLFPVLVPRWDVTGMDAYGQSCPGMEALGSIKELQSLMKKKGKGVQKQLDPPLTGPTALRTQKTSLISGDITYVDVRDGVQGLRPIHETKFSHADVREDIRDLERRIGRTFYAPLFLMISQMEGIQPRNEREIAERHEEKLLALGPVLERTNDEFLDPLTKLELHYITKNGMLPRPPDEMRGMPLNIEYVSMMAQAQKLIGIAGTERFLAFVGNLSGMWPDVKDKVDADKAVDDYADRMGVSANITVDDEIVKAKRDARAQAQQQAAQAQMAANATEAAKQLSQADMSTDNALTRMMAGA